MFENISLFTIFTTGLIAGGVTCIAVQGGLLTATLAGREQEKIEQKVADGNLLPILSFIIAKLLAYTLLGFLLGWLGSLMQISLQVSVILQFAVVIFMFGTALNLLNVHPIFRYFAIQPPHFLTRMIRKQSKRSDIFAPALLGALTVFIPCGTTQAMMALAIASGNAFVGATILFVYVLGTSPLFFALGYFTMKLGDVLQQQFMKVAAVIILLFALFTLDSAIALTGTPYAPSRFFHETYCVISYCDDSLRGNVRMPVTDVTITMTSSGYAPRLLTVPVGQKVTLRLVNQGAGGCIQAFTIPSLHIQKIVAPDTSDTVTFTAPTKPTKLTFMCSMGMYSGVIDVI